MSTTVYGLSMSGRLECFGGRRSVYSRKLFRSESAAWADKDAFVERSKIGDGFVAFVPDKFFCNVYELEDE